MGIITDFLALAVIGLLGAASPGPDFVIVTQNSLKYGKRAGIATAIGIALGCLVHVTYCIIGIGVIVAESVLLFNIIKYLGAAYLIYIGAKALFGKQSSLILPNDINTPSAALNTKQALKNGFLINVLNPKATLFFLSVFSQVIDPSTSRFIQTLYGIELSMIALVWFSTLCLILTHPILRQKLLHAQKAIEKTLGGFLILFGLKIATVKL